VRVGEERTAGRWASRQPSIDREKKEGKKKGGVSVGNAPASHGKRGYLICRDRSVVGNAVCPIASERA